MFRNPQNRLLELEWYPNPPITITAITINGSFCIASTVLFFNVC